MPVIFGFCPTAEPVSLKGGAGSPGLTSAARDCICSYDVLLALLIGVTVVKQAGIDEIIRACVKRRGARCCCS